MYHYWYANHCSSVCSLLSASLSNFSLFIEIQKKMCAALELSYFIFWYTAKKVRIPGLRKFIHVPYSVEILYDFALFS